MTDHERFETRLEARLLARAAQGDRSFDPDAIARAAVVRARSTGAAGWYRRPGGVGTGIGRVQPLRWPRALALLAGLLLLTVGAALVAGGLPRPSLVPPERGVFTPAGLSAVFDRHDGWTATLLDAGGVLIAGGYSSPDTAETWDPDTRSFSLTGGLIRPRYGHTATLLGDGRVLVLGGHCKGCWVTTEVAGPILLAEAWDPRTGAFAAVGSLASADALAWPPILLPDGRVLVGRGAAAEVFDPTTDTFAPAGPLGDLPEPRSGVHLPDGRVLTIGVGSSSLWDPRTDTVTQTSGLLQSHGNTFATVVLADGRVLVLGGNMTNGKSIVGITAAEIWDPATGRFSATGSMLQGAAFYMTATLLADGRVLVFTPGEDVSAQLFELK